MVVQLDVFDKIYRNKVDQFKNRIYTRACKVDGQFGRNSQYSIM